MKNLRHIYRRGDLVQTRTCSERHIISIRSIKHVKVSCLGAGDGNSIKSTKMGEPDITQKERRAKDGSLTNERDRERFKYNRKYRQLSADY